MKVVTTYEQTAEALESNLVRLGLPESKKLAMHLSDIAEELPRLTEALEDLFGMSYDLEGGALGAIDASLSHLLNHIPQAAQIIETWMESDEGDAEE